MLLTATVICSCCSRNSKRDMYADRAAQTLDSVFKYYGVEDSHLFRETYPFNADYRATYLDSENNRPNEYSYLWPNSSLFSALSALYEATGDDKYKKLLDGCYLPGLERYFDTVRKPAAYASYVNGAPQSDRFYDDNIWLGIDFTDMYALTQERQYLDKAELIWKFIESGMDDKLGGGIYWCEQKKRSKNTCSNAPGSVYALKLFKATGNEYYLEQGKELYAWTKEHLQDSTDYLYFDNISIQDGGVAKQKYAYNSGQMMQAAALLYRITKDKTYLTEAQDIAEACYNHFFEDFTAGEGDSFRILRPGNLWFHTVMSRGYIELSRIDKNNKYVDAIARSLDYAWEHTREGNGLFSEDLSGRRPQNTKGLLTEGAIVEMYARIAGALH